MRESDRSRWLRGFFSFFSWFAGIFGFPRRRPRCYMLRRRGGDDATLSTRGTSMPFSTSPNAHDTIFPPLGQVAVFYSHPLHNRWSSSFGASFSIDTSATIPMPPIRAIVDFRDAFACRSNDSTRVEHHACDGVVVSVGVDDAAGTKVPYLVLH